MQSNLLQQHERLVENSQALRNNEYSKGSYTPVSNQNNYSE